MRESVTDREKYIAKSIMVAAPLIGRISMLFFVIFLFTGPLRFINLELSELTVLIWNTLLSLMFFVQHSCMIRRSFRARFLNYIPSHYNDAVFTIVSSIILIVIVIFWQPSTTVVYELHGLQGLVLRCIFFIGIAGIVWGVLSLKFFDPYGRIPIRDYLKGKSKRSHKFSVYGPYFWVRHPLYFFVLLLIWSCPILTADRILFNILWTVWIFVGTVLEEKDLVSDFGEDYCRYQKEVPMLIPWKIPKNK